MTAPCSPSPWPLVVVDWGTSNLRAYLVDEAGTVLSSQASTDGVKSVSKAGFPQTYAQIMRSFGQDRPALLVGMIGSSLGWLEAPVQPTPISPDALSAHLTPVPSTNAHIVPGIAARSVVGAIDMMRGEETQALGAMETFDLSDGTICLPGTHSKWLTLQNGKVVKITTAMTGEVFELMSKGSVLRQHIADADASHDRVSFEEGLALAQTGIGVMQLAFSTRARALVEGKGKARSYLSGLIIGAEVEAMVRIAQINNTVLIAAPALTELYARAFEHFDIQSRTMSGERAVALGAARIWHAHLNTSHS